MTPKEASDLFYEVETEFGEDKSTEFILSMCVERSCIDVPDFCTLLFQHEKISGNINRRFEPDGKIAGKTE